MADYGVNQITSLEGLSAIQQRPAMYIGSTSQLGVNQIIYEVWDNSLDEYGAGYGNEINVLIDQNNYITIEDHGRGIPVGPHPEWKNEDGTPMNTLTGVLTKLHAGGKFNRDGTSGYFNGSAGTYGIGSKATNALSDDFIVQVKRDGKIYQQTFSKGKATSEVEVIGKSKDTGTTIKFHPDKDIFKETIEPNDKKLQSRLHEITALNADLKINYKNELAKVDKVFHYPNGIIDYIKDELLLNKKLLFDTPLYYKSSYTNEDETMQVEFSFVYQDAIEDNQIIKTFANNITTREHGTHLQGFKDGFKECINNYATKNKLITQPLEIKYILENICLIISVHLKECELEGQTKNKLGNTIAQDGVKEVVSEFFSKLNKEQKEVLNTIIIRANAVKEAEEAARKAKINSRKANKVTKMALPGKLADCATNKGYSECFFCLKGDTKVKLLDGTSPTIESLVGKENLEVYSANSSKRMIPAKITSVFKTQEVNQTIKIGFNDGSFVECTPEHKFLDSQTWSWIEAKNLKVEQYLASLKFKEGKENIWKLKPMKLIKNCLGITSIEYINYDEPIPVYCLNIDNEFHAFVLDNGLITHNCEGDSAAGSAISARNSLYQAIMPLRGKILNTEKVDFDKAISSDTAKSLIACIGTGVGKNFDISKCRYDKLIMMCFTGDTKIKLLDGTSPTFEELVEKEKNHPNQNYWVYSCTENGEIVPGKAHHPRITKYIDEIIEITLDNNEVIKCTPDHLFMLRDSSYKQAINLTDEDSLMSYCKNYNHKIISKKIIKLDKQIPVYDITVEEYHNFALHSGVFVHNCDADVDGLHISNLIMTLIYNYMRPLIEHGYLYMACPPLYKIINKKERLYLKDDVELKQYRKKHSKDNYIVNRFKGLGEMDANELAESVMNPETRTLKRITIEDVEEMINTFNICMGSDVKIRREFIEQNAHLAEIDV